MITLNLPSFNFRYAKSGNTVKIYDVVRQKFVVLTPEEWVRQHFVKFLAAHKDVPISHMALEKEFLLAERSKRFDAVVYNKMMKPVMLFEFKAPHVQLETQAFEQINTYNTVLKIPYLVLSNGLSHFGFHFVDEDNCISFSNVEALPKYGML